MLCQSKTHQPRARDWDTQMFPRQGNRKLTKAPSSHSFPRVNPSALSLSLSSLFTRYTVLGSRTDYRDPQISKRRRPRALSLSLSLSLDEPSPKDNEWPFCLSPGEPPLGQQSPTREPFRLLHDAQQENPHPGTQRAILCSGSGPGQGKRHDGNEKHESRITNQGRVGDRKARNQVARSLDVRWRLPPHAQDWDRRLREAIMKPAGRIGILLLHSEGGVGRLFFFALLTKHI
jgi:hypothetical protein